MNGIEPSLDLIRAFQARAEQARKWLFTHACPLWAKAGPHPAWGFRERLDMSAAPMEEAGARMRVQARQTWCFAYALTMGWQTGTARALVEHGVEALLSKSRRQSGLYGLRVNFATGPEGDSDSLYDCAFVLLALTWSAHALQDPDIARAAEALGEAIDRHFRHEHGGYHASLPQTDTRLQNPHMHMFEASLAHTQLTGNAASKRRCTEILDLLRTRFCDEKNRLHEAFNPDWTPHKDDHFEAGHQFEWVWLLAQWQKHSGDSCAETIAGLYRFGLILTASDGRLPLSHASDGVSLRDPVCCRCWSQTEALKAHLACMEHGDPQASARAIDCFDQIWSDHLDKAPAGSWIDTISLEGDTLSTDIPASTFYHILLAFAEWIRLTQTWQQV